MDRCPFEAIKGLILCHPEGALISIDDLFLMLNSEDLTTSSDSMRKAFSDLSKKKEVVRICNGIYCKVNKNDPVIRSDLSINEILEVIARDNNWVIRPGIEMSRKLLGLPYIQKYDAIYACSGTTHTYKLDIGGTIQLYKISGKFMTSSLVSEKAALVTIALLDLKTHKITAHEIAHLSDTLSDADKEDLMRARPYIPARLRPVFEIICGEYGVASR